MGIINITPDSFSDGGDFFVNGKIALHHVREKAEEMIESGADILDIGGESARPGALPVSISEEIERVIPVLEELKDLPTILSLDTSKPEVAEQGIEAGCNIINDIRGFSRLGMLEVAAAASVGLCIMHMQGVPETMQADPAYDDISDELLSFFEKRIGACLDRGIKRNRLILDPGFGFGKNLDHNLALLNNLERMRVGGLPIMVGLSRKSMLGALTGRPVSDRVVASAVANAIAFTRGANIFRVHDVAATSDALKVVQAMAWDNVGEKHHE
ncbi:MAG: dihydropteroate synthase [Gammaproteobacteria bacterium]|nr:dihydropteroate synthase [Gammaproteobacteria bacterium]